MAAHSLHQVRKTSAQGSRLNEAKYINKSLSALGNVINALTQVQSNRPSLRDEGTLARVATTTNTSTKSTPHIPFRDSKLTRLLQGSLSGNAKTVLVLTVSSDISNLMETIATLRFGERAKQLKTAPKINTEKTEASLKKALARAEKQLVALNGTVEELRRELASKDSQLDKLRLACDVSSHTSKGKVESVDECSRCLLLTAENERLLAALAKIPSLSVAPLSPSQPSLQSPKEVKQQMSDKIHSLQGGQEDMDRTSLPLGYEDTRCGVCGLNERETEVLYVDTGEHLGGFFTCDGNCGNSFHVRCAGEVGDGGQYVVPAGEWFCTACSVGDDAPPEVMMCMGPLSPSVVSISNAKVKTGGDVSSTEAMSTDQQIARLQAEYHAMRRERNRVLNQWQHERRLASKSTEYRDQRERDLDEEIVACKEIIEKLQDDVQKGYSEQMRLKKLLDDMVEAQQQTQKALDVEFRPLSVRRKGMERSATRGGRRSRYHDDGSEATGPSLRNSPTACHDDDSAMSKAMIDCPSGDAGSEAIMAALVTRSGGRHLSGTASPVVAVVDIPKPWLKKNASLSASAATKRERNEGVGEVINGQSVDDNDSPPSRLSTSPIRSIKGTKRMSSNGDDGPSTSQPHDGTYVESIGTLEPLGVLDSQDVDFMGPASRRSPINNRLKNLLKSVKEETGSFAEIRKKYRDRETERLVLRSRHKGRDTTGRSTLSTSLPAIL